MKADVAAIVCKRSGSREMAGSAGTINEKQQFADGESRALAEIVAWSRSRPIWQRDALRRLCEKGMLDDVDFDELTEMCICKGEGAVPLEAKHVPNPSMANAAVNLGAVRRTENVNALKPGERLTFASTGLTVVYGDNGSGKSGYARILKKMCRARIARKDDKILPNIYAKKNEPQVAEVEYSVGGKNCTAKWVPDGPGDPSLFSVGVFDSRTANVHVDEKNDVAYKPFPMLVLEQLAAACREIKNRIDQRIMELQHQSKDVAIQQFHDGTEVWKLVSNLSGATSIEHARNLAELSDKDRARHYTLGADFSDDPEKVAGRLQSQLSRLRTFDERIRSLQKAISDEQIQRLDLNRVQLRTARAAASAAAKDLFSGDPLPDIGSEAWRDLWEAARRYSEQHAYSGSTYPVVSDGARCVLCQQDLSEEAASRLNRFEEFVQEETKRREEVAASAYQDALKATADAKVPEPDILAAESLIRDEIGDDKLATATQRAARTLSNRMEAVLRYHANGEEFVLPTIADAWPAEAIDGRCAAMSERLAAALDPEKSDERTLLHAEFKELEDRTLLAANMGRVVSEILRRQAIDKLKSAQMETATNQITKMSSKVAGHLVTNALRNRFAEEFCKFEFPGLKVELGTESRYGVPLFQVHLSENRKISAGNVLSEGEHRCVALAAFLAELATTGSGSAIVFDDPVSSLDHAHRESVANRLTEEAKHRQIVVFTHDPVFLFALDRACHEKDAEISHRYVARNAEFSGIVRQYSPLRIQPVHKTIKRLRSHLNNAKHHYQVGDHSKWEVSARGLLSQLRSTWERAVENAVGPVVKRFDHKVDTSGLAKVAVLKPDDCRTVRQARNRISKRLHSSANAVNPKVASPVEIQREIEALENWVADLTERQKKSKCLCD